MCFRIGQKAKRPEQRTVYKIVRLESGYLSSVIYPKKTVQHVWSYPGAVVRAVGETTTDLENDAMYTMAGIYVYLTKDLAKIYCYPGTRCVIIALSVNPKDWLFTSWNGQEATYKKVTIKEEQPFIEWY